MRLIDRLLRANLATDLKALVDVTFDPAAPTPDGMVYVTNESLRFVTTPYGELVEDGLMSTLRARLTEAVPVVFDNVTEYLFAENSQETWLYREHFPCVAPPWPLFWAETRKPSQILSEVNGTMPWGPKRLTAWGMLVTSGVREGGGFESRALQIAEHDGQLMAYGQWRWNVGADGVMMGDTEHTDLHFMPLAVESPFRQIWYFDLERTLFPFFMALSFCHCKNVTLQTQRPAAQLQKATMRRHGQPLKDYKVIRIDAAQRMLDDVGQRRTVGLGNALRNPFVRGHYAHYGDRWSKGKLFGKLEGLYWIPMHARVKGRPVDASRYTVQAPESS
jgi:hypothetical protein